jgi:hypothetical protein
MTAPQTTTPDLQAWDVLALRLMLAHLEEDALDRDLHRELIYADSGMSAGQFHMVDRIAWMNARAMVKNHEGKALRADLLKLLESVIG